MLVPCKVLKGVAKATSNKETRQALQYVRVREVDQTVVIAEATDGKILVSTLVDHGFDRGEYPLRPQPEQHYPSLIHAADCARLAKVAGNRPFKPILGCAAITETQAHATDLEATTSVRLGEVQLPDLKDMIKKITEQRMKAEIVLDLVELKKLVDTLLAVHGTEKDKVSGYHKKWATMKIPSEAEEPVVFEVDDETGFTFSAICPVVIPS